MWRFILGYAGYVPSILMHFDDVNWTPSDANQMLYGIGITIGLPVYHLLMILIGYHPDEGFMAGFTPTWTAGTAEACDTAARAPRGLEAKTPRSMGNWWLQVGDTPGTWAEKNCQFGLRI